MEVRRSVNTRRKHQHPPNDLTQHQPQTELKLGKQTHPALPLDLRDPSREPWRVFRSGEFSILWAATDDAGWTSLINAADLPRRETSGLKSSVSIDWLNGRGSVPLPPRLYDMLLFYQRPGTLNEYFSYDIAASAGLYTDFEDSAREGLRFPAHAVSAFHVPPELDVILGADFPDRDDFTNCLSSVSQSRIQRFVVCDWNSFFPDHESSMHGTGKPAVTSAGTLPAVPGILKCRTAQVTL